MPSSVNKRGWVPKLRFPEFRDAGEWEAKPFDELFTIGNGKNYKHLSNGDVPVYGSGGYMLSVNDCLHDGESVCIGRKGTINNPMFLTGKFWTVDTLFYTHSFNDCLPRFIYSIFQNIDWLKHNEAGGVPSLSKTNIGKIKVAVPKQKEQQKIADCLASLDELITLEAKKLDTLKTHKKGLMQQLFPAEGETLPKLRFPEFRDAGEWVAMKLNNACDVNPGNSELPEEFAYIDLESVEAGELKARKIINRDEAPSRAQRLLRYGDVIFQIVRPYQRNNFHFRIDDDVRYVASTGYAQLRANESADFLFQAVHTDDFVGRVVAKCTGSSYPAINSSDLADISIAIPSSDEQQRIADCLASLDDLITAQTQKLAALKTHKKGLMQQLFPALSET